MKAADIAKLARAALMAELDATPKPGLVDRANNGAHRDMGYDTFAASAVALEPYFTDIAALGGRLAGLDEGGLLAALRGPGKAAEGAMLAATGGVNTHKGAIFSIGLLCAAAGRHTALGLPRSPDALCATVARMTAGICDRELGGGGGTAGQRVYRRYGAPGARGEAESGFLSVRRHGLPVLEASLAAREPCNTALVRTLISLMAHVTDTNVLARRGQSAALWLGEQAGFLHHDFTLEGVTALDEACIERNISPGGCADLLAVTVFLHGLGVQAV